jgi:quinohemoprotein ethanol dehydrogenase
MPQDPKIKKAILDTVKGKLVAWDPLQQKQAWVVERPGPWNGGTLSTAGNLVFEGTAGGNFEAYRASTGEKLWSFAAQTGVMAGPVTYTIHGEQYVAVLAGWGGVFPLATGEVSFKSGPVRNISRMLVFKSGGKENLPALEPPEEARPLLPLPNRASGATIRKGETLFQRYCAACHGDVAVSGGVLPDLRYSGTLDSNEWFSDVLGGMLQSEGMVSFAKELSHEDAASIRAYVIFRRNQSVAQKKSDAARN